MSKIKGNWVNLPEEVDNTSPWDPGPIDNIILETMTNETPGLLFTGPGGINLLFVWGMRHPMDQSHWFITKGYIADVSKKLWLRSGYLQEEWIRCCKEYGITRCTIWFESGSAVQKVFGENTVCKMPKYYKDPYWFDFEGGTYLTYSIDV